MSAVDVAALAAHLAEATANVDQLVQERAEVLAADLVREAQRLAKEAQAERAGWEQRFQDLKKELERQRPGLERLEAQARLDATALRWVRMLHIWTNEDYRKFVFADDLEAALSGNAPKAGS